ncbi:hypothetical protein [Luteimonas terrae]|uniref:Uncharacterized protein n=1 Tax=Luteimonas terrae TaxID=1530191 RepID=A0ABU1XTD1_9GAMM|nr:hypothetical protein [Luteimonas terrae]MDR7192015.1 hypothetical protein [Luteimonas terrae]
MDVCSTTERNSLATEIRSAEPLTEFEAWQVRAEFSGRVTELVTGLNTLLDSIAAREELMDVQVELGVHDIAGRSETDYRESLRQDPVYSEIRAASAELAQYLDEELPHALPAFEPPPLLATAPRDDTALLQAAYTALNRATSYDATDPSTLENVHSVLETTMKVYDNVDRAVGLFGGTMPVMAERISQAVTATTAVSDLVSGISRMQQGNYSAGTMLETGLAAGELVGGAAWLAGRTVPGLGPALVVGELFDKVVSTIEQRAQFQAMTAEGMSAAGLPASVVDGLAGADFASIRALQSAGVTREHILELSQTAPNALGMPVELTAALVEVLPLRGEALADALAVAGTHVEPLFHTAAAIAHSGERGPTTPENFATWLEMGPEPLAPPLEAFNELLRDSD